MKTSTEQECLLLITAALLLQAADRAPGGFRKRLQGRAEEMLDEAAALDEEVVPYISNGLRFDADLTPAQSIGPDVHGDLDIEIDEPASLPAPPKVPSGVDAAPLQAVEPKAV